MRIGVTVGLYLLPIIYRMTSLASVSKALGCAIISVGKECVNPYSMRERAELG